MYDSFIFSQTQDKVFSELIPGFSVGIGFSLCDNHFLSLFSVNQQNPFFNSFNNAMHKWKIDIPG